jgi:hypothetical protein
MFLIEPILAGVVGTTIMSVLMAVIHQAQWANADMIRALGSMATKREDNALGPGLLIHFISGIAFAFPYSWVLGSFGFESAVATTGVGGLFGLMHGACMSFVLMAVSERHPIERFRKASVEVGAAHVVGHIGYGAGVGLVFGLFAG